jgi:hypothetical protein
MYEHETLGKSNLETLHFTRKQTKAVTSTLPTVLKSLKYLSPHSDRRPSLAQGFTTRATSRNHSGRMSDPGLPKPVRPVRKPDVVLPNIYLTV